MTDKPKKFSKARWGILRDTLLEQRSSAHKHSGVTRRPTGAFGLVKTEVVVTSEVDKNSHLIDYVYDNIEVRLRQRKDDAFVLDDFKISNEHKIDNTGVICLWPAEEALTHFCVKNSHIFRDKRVLELGAGVGLAGIALAAMGIAKEVVLTDGNPTCVDVLQENLERNNAKYGRTMTRAEVLHWDRIATGSTKYDVIIAADCTFFKDFHGALARSIHQLLAPRGEVYMLNPSRSGSVERFTRCTN
ncbi:hypothetical protein CYMTET_48216 [Cymbomonas tetramitiformis]|uniref:Calmodulin-lysine N-methyltransferase n=1 Tax=Cymbomonas tetramitiformis TaxID=36881 RepID=A0AAE0BSU1_9CHLO|nr:hypothetical protein CYMTET_48216 [Cymbomonas tetramitiformis]